MVYLYRSSRHIRCVARKSGNAAQTLCLVFSIDKVTRRGEVATDTTLELSPPPLGQSKFNKRPLEEEPSENPFESSVKHPCPGPGGQHPNQGQQRPSANNQQQQQQQQQSTENNLKFSVEIVQQLEFTTSTANNQTQQISANVTVKATSVKNDVSTTSSAASSPQSRGGGATPSAPQPPPPPGPGGDLVECKMEPEFVDLAHCTLDKDGHFNGDAFPNLTDFTFDDATDDFDSVKLTDLFSEITDLHPDIIKEFGFDDHKGAGSLMDGLGGLRGGNFKMEDDVKDFNPHPSSGLSDVLNKPGQQQQHSPSPHVGAQYSPRVGAYPPGLTDHGSPAAQTLKQMAEQHQHKTQLGISPFNPARSPYEYQGGGEYLGSPGAEGGEYLGSPGAAPAGSPYLKQGTAGGGSFVNNTAQSEMVKQEGGMSFSASQQQAFSAELHKRQQHQAALQQQQQQLQQQQQQQANKAGATQGGGASGYPGGKQQYSYGGSPGGSPQYRGGGGGPQLGQFGRSTPPRPPSCPGPGLQVNQGQHVHVAQQGQQCAGNISNTASKVRRVDRSPVSLKLVPTFLVTPVVGRKDAWRL
uniref:Uncharacterized protein n=1 Tax=Timema cristinae TaxID=61476 RepID=A0A7R9H0X5_TIMCR|nr:unnamed protein product [Timema cristinae]